VSLCHIDVLWQPGIGKGVIKNTNSNVDNVKWFFNVQCNFSSPDQVIEPAQQNGQRIEPQESQTATPQLQFLQGKIHTLTLGQSGSNHIFFLKSS